MLHFPKVSKVAWYKGFRDLSPLKAFPVESVVFRPSPGKWCVFGNRFGNRLRFVK